MRRPVWIVPLVLAVLSLACYSDSPLYPFELTPAPPTVTPLPTPLPTQNRFRIDDLAYVPASVTEAAFRLDMTIVPEPLKPDLSNKSPQSCSQNSVVRILYSAITPEGVVYQLIDCRGVVGRTPERNLLGPIELVTNQRALTIGQPASAFEGYTIEASDPPYRQDDPFRQTFNCKFDDTVDVVAMSGFSTGELYYKIRCTDAFNPVQKNVGWTTSDRLFGPVRFRNGETGIVPQDVARITLTTTPNGDEASAECLAGERIQITQTPVQRLQDRLFYELECAAGKGWADQDLLAGPIPYELGQAVLVTAPGVANSAQTNPDERPTVIMTTNAGPLLTTNQAGTCPDASVVDILAFAGVDEALYAQVRCNDVLGWLELSLLYGPVLYEPGQTVTVGEKALLGFNQRGIYLSVNLFNIEGPSGGASVIAGECAFDLIARQPTQAEILDVGYYRAATGEVVGVFYRAACQNPAGERIEGWINQSRIGD